MDSVSGVGVIDKGVLILRALRGGPLDLAQLQHASGLPRATAHRLAVALEQHHLVRRDAAGPLLPRLRAGRARPSRRGAVRARRARPRRARATSATRHRRERAAVRARGRRSALRGVAAVAARAAMDRPGGQPAAARASARRAGCCAARDPRADGPRASRSARRASRRSAHRSGTATGAIVAAVSVSGPIERLTREPGIRLGSAVVAAAAAIAARLAGRPT